MELPVFETVFFADIFRLHEHLDPGRVFSTVENQLRERKVPNASFHKFSNYIIGRFAYGEAHERREKAAASR